jgi:hypothetical protein
MSRTIDERIVEMRFDNRQFEQNVQTSLSTLDKLKRGLDLDNAAKSLDGLGDAAKRCDMSVLGKSVETVQAKFSAFQVVAMTTLSNITNSAVNTGKRLVSALTIDPIKTGFQEYETQIGAVQTILANTQHEGTNLQQVNRALDELNTYADKTIYNFTEMTRNIGTFTAAGVNLRTSADSIKGIANLAAISGSTSQQASTAMYQLSQALAAGKVSLMDWNSVVNAGMGGKVFQDALVRTSELLGTGAQNAINMYGSFRESLTRGEWLTTEVLTETLKQFAGAYSEADLIQQGFSEAQARDIAQMAKTAEDAATKVKTFTQLWDTLKESAQSGWTTTWEILVGDFEEAKEVLTEVSDAIGGVISETSQARNELLSGGLSSGWKQLLDQGIADEGGFIESIQEVARESGDAFDKLVADSESFSDALKQGLTDGVVSSETLTQAVHNLREKMTGMSQEERKAAGYTAEMIEQIEALDKGLQNGSVSMEEFTEKILRPSGRENLIQAVWNAAKGLVSVITPIKDAFREIFPPATADQLYSLTETLRSFSERLTLSEETADKLGRTFKGLFSVLDLVRQGALAIFNALAPLGSGAGSLADGILTITAGIGDFLVGINEAAKQGEFFGMVAQTVASALEFVVSGIERLTGFLADAFAAPGLESFQALLGRIQTRIGQVVDAVSGLGGGVSDVADTMDSALENSKFLQMLQTIFNGAKTLVSGIIGVFGGLAGALVENLSNANFSSVIDLLNGVSLGAIALGIKKFLDSFREVTDSVGSIKEGVIGILDGVKGCFQAWQNDVNAKALLKIAAAVAVLSASILTISLIDSEKLTASLGAITVLFTELMAAMAVFGKLDLNVRGTMKRSTAMIALSSSVLILASALKSIATLEPEQMAAGLAGIAGLMAALGAAPGRPVVRIGGAAPGGSREGAGLRFKLHHQGFCPDGGLCRGNQNTGLGLRRPGPAGPCRTGKGSDRRRCAAGRGIALHERGQVQRKVGGHCLGRSGTGRRYEGAGLGLQRLCPDGCWRAGQGAERHRRGPAGDHGLYQAGRKRQGADHHRSRHDRDWRGHEDICLRYGGLRTDVSGRDRQGLAGYGRSPGRGGRGHALYAPEHGNHGGGPDRGGSRAEHHCRRHAVHGRHELGGCRKEPGHHGRGSGRAGRWSELHERHVGRFRRHAGGCRRAGSADAGAGYAGQHELGSHCQGAGHGGRRLCRHRNGRRTAHSAAADDSWPGRRLRSDRRWCCRRWGRSAPCRNRPIRHCGGHYGPGNLPWSGRSHYRGRPDLYHHGHRGADPGHCGEAG